ncbi:unnamed protein product, partial [Cladocopium goreaui]
MSPLGSLQEGPIPHRVTFDETNPDEPPSKRRAVLEDIPEEEMEEVPEPQDDGYSPSLAPDDAMPEAPMEPDMPELPPAAPDDVSNSHDEVMDDQPPEHSVSSATKHQRVTAMSDSVQGPLSEPEMHMAGGLLARAITYGQSQRLSKVIFNSIGGKPLAVNAYYFLKHTGEEVGTMADSSKRQRDFDLESWDNVTESGVNSPAASSRAGYPDISYQGMMPHVEPPFPGSGKGFTNDEDVTIPMPNDVANVDEWSQTVLKLPKVADLKITYGQFLERAKNDPDLSKYANYIIETFGPHVKNKKTTSYTQGVDFAHFLCRVKYVQQSHGGPLTPIRGVSDGKSNGCVPLSLMEPVGADNKGAEGHHHGMGDLSFPSAVASALINHMLMFGMCCAYGMIIFSEERHSDHRALGVKMCLAAAFVSGGLMSICSGIPIAIGGTDLNPAVFYGDFVVAIANAISADLGLDDYSYDDYSGGRRLAKKDKTKYFCKGTHKSLHQSECETYHEELRATVIFSVALSTLLLALLWSVLGKLKLTRYVGYMPYSISEAFLACVGYKVFFYALKFCDMEPQQFMPAALIGIALYFIKALHIGNPTIMMPLGLLVPLCIFWGVVFATGENVDSMRQQGWLFVEIGNEPFWWVWTDSIGKYGSINFSAWARTLPDLAVFIIVSTMDCVLKIHATESKLPLKPDSDKEAFKFGCFNYILAACGAATGYMQLKFNVISYGVMRNARDRRAGMMYALLCAACYFSTVEHFNYLPKLFLSALLFFAGAGFVTDNMWGSRKFLHVNEWLEIVIIVIVFIVAGQLIWAVLAGVILSGIAFIAKCPRCTGALWENRKPKRYARVPAIVGRPRKGDEVNTRDRPVGEVGHQSFMHIASEWIMIVHLKGYVFFSSCVSIVRQIEEKFQHEDKHQVESFRRLKFLVFDAKSLDGMDASGAMSMLKLSRKANQRGIRVFWSGLKDDLAEEMKHRHILKDGGQLFEDLHSAMTHLEKRILQYKAQQQREWMNLHPAFVRDRKLMEQRINFEPFREVFLSDGARLGCPWRYCSRLSIKSFKTMLCVPGDLHRPLYLVHTGAVAVLDAVPEEGSKDQKWQRPRFVLRQGWFVNANSLVGAPSDGYAVAVEDGEVLFWTEEQWWHMANEHPLMMMELSKAVMRQQGSHHLHRDPEARVEDTITMAADIEEEEADGLAMSWMRGVSEDTEAEEDDDVIPTEHHILQKVSNSREIRRTHEVLCSPIVLGDAFNRESLTKLPQLQTRILEMHFARALGELGFFRKDSAEGVLPELPRVLLDDLRVAFYTFAQRPDDQPT